MSSSGSTRKKGIFGGFLGILEGYMNYMLHFFINQFTIINTSPNAKYCRFLVLPKEINDQNLCFLMMLMITKLSQSPALPRAEAATTIFLKIIFVGIFLVFWSILTISQTFQQHLFK